MPYLFYALMSIPVAFVIVFWFLVSYDGLRDPATRKSSILFLVCVASVEIGIWVWVLTHP